MVEPLKLSELKEGQEFEFTYGPITREGIKAYASASGDKNPIHINEDFATNVGKLKGVIAHGMYSFGIASRFISDLAGDAKVIRLGCQMRGMVRPGDDLVMKAVIKKIDGKKVSIEVQQYSKTKIKIEKDGQVVKKFEAEERGWISQKDIDRGLIKTEETPEGTLYYRYRLSIPAFADILFE
ncbi:MAG: MaoC family dehydratase [Promethearchaeota archaeon]